MNNKGNLIIFAILIIAAIGAFIYFSYLLGDSESVQNELGFDVGIEEVGERLGSIPSIPSVPATSSGGSQQAVEQENTESEQPEEIVPANMIRFTEKGFVPERIVISQGTELIFRNDTDLALQALTRNAPGYSNQAYAGWTESKTLAKGETWSTVMLIEGVYSYTERFNSGHLGTIVVTEQ